MYLKLLRYTQSEISAIGFTDILPPFGLNKQLRRTGERRDTCDYGWTKFSSIKIVFINAFFTGLFYMLKYLDDQLQIST